MDNNLNISPNRTNFTLVVKMGHEIILRFPEKTYQRLKIFTHLFGNVIQK